MSSAEVTIKTEDGVDESAAPPPKPPPPDEDELQPLTLKHSNNRKYPPGCPVWYDLQSSNKSLEASCGIVKVYILLYIKIYIILYVARVFVLQSVDVMYLYFQKL